MATAQFDSLYEIPDNIPGLSTSCMELAAEGERLCKAGDHEAGIQYFRAALDAGIKDERTLSAIYSQMGNAFFYLQDFQQAYEHHEKDLQLARAMGDHQGEAKACGNLGNTYKVMGKFDEAISWCQRSLDICKEIGDRVGEAHALYNLGNVYHTQGRQATQLAKELQGIFPPQVKLMLTEAAEYYKQNLALVRELGVRSAQGRVCGNLGNTYYLLGDFELAIKFHEERLSIAREFGDREAERRAYCNLANAHIFLGEFNVAAEHYKRTLNLAKDLSNLALEAQACYSLGNTYTLLRDFGKAIDYHMQHLRIAGELKDRVGEGRAYWSLGNAYTQLGNHNMALRYASQHLKVSQEINDLAGLSIAQDNINDLKVLLGITSKEEEASGSLGNDTLCSVDSGASAYSASRLRPARQRRISMENLSLVKLTPENKALKKSTRGAATPGTKPSRTGVPKTKSDNTIAASAGASNNAAASISEEESFLDLISRHQSRRYDDQRCALRPIVNNNHPPRSIVNDHEAEGFVQRRPAGGAAAAISPRQALNGNGEDEDFFEQLMRIQASRIEDQRSYLPRLPPAPTVPDEDFLCLIQRMQSNRLDEQRTALPPRQESLPKPTSAAELPATEEMTFSRFFRRKKSKKDKKSDK